MTPTGLVLLAVRCRATDTLAVVDGSFGRIDLVTGVSFADRAGAMSSSESSTKVSIVKYGEKIEKSSPFSPKESSLAIRMPAYGVSGRVMAMLTRLEQLLSLVLTGMEIPHSPVFLAAEAGLLP